MYKVKDGIEIIEIGEEGTVFYDGDTGNTNILDGVAADIMNCFKESGEPEKVIEMLAEIYSAEKNEIRNDVLEFIPQLVEAGLLIDINTGEGN